MGRLDYKCLEIAFVQIILEYVGYSTMRQIDLSSTVNMAL